MKHSAAIVTFADLGERENLKTQDILPVIKVFRERGALSQIICRMGTGYDFPNTVSAVPKSVHWTLALMGTLSAGMLRTRFLEERIFDFFAKRRLKRTEVVIFHHDYFLPDTIDRARRDHSVAIGIAVTAHGKYNTALEKEEFLRLGLNDAFPRQIIYGKLDKRGVFENRCDYIIAISDFVKKTYVAEGIPPENVYVAYSDIDIRHFAPKPAGAGDVFRVLYVAHTSPLKGLHYLLDAWSNLRLPNSELALVGGYGVIPQKLKDRYETVISKTPSIRWIGYTRRPEEYYRSASVFVLPSLTEGNPHVVMEAMASGLPVITTENARSIVEDGKTGFIVPIRNPEAIREKIEFLYRNPGKRQEMGSAARQAVLNKTSFGEAVFEIYKKILNRGA